MNAMSLTRQHQLYCLFVRLPCVHCVSIMCILSLMRPDTKERQFSVGYSTIVYSTLLYSTLTTGNTKCHAILSHV